MPVSLLLLGGGIAVGSGGCAARLTREFPVRLTVYNPRSSAPVFAPN